MIAWHIGETLYLPFQPTCYFLLKIQREIQGQDHMTSDAAVNCRPSLHCITTPPTGQKPPDRSIHHVVWFSKQNHTKEKEVGPKMSVVSCNVEFFTRAFENIFADCKSTLPRGKKLQGTCWSDSCYITETAAWLPSFRRIWSTKLQGLDQLCPTQMAYWAKKYVTILTRAAHSVTY